MSYNLTLGSLFDGSGGFPLGGLLHGIKPIWASEIEPFPIRVTTKRLPSIKHYGDISSLDGGKIEPVDIITFGSPCQDMSLAGKRDGLGGERSSLFYEAIRIIKEMRCATNDKYPKYIVWENVPGAFSSNKGEDFKYVLESICHIKDETLSVPKPDKWRQAGNIVGNDFSIAWRVLDAQYWGVPQRRKRIYLVADFTGGSAGEILFKSEGMSGYSKESCRPWQETAGNVGDGSNKAGIGFDGYNGSLTYDKSATLGVNCGISTGRNGVVLNDQFVFENHSQDARYTGPHDVAQTVLSTFGTGGNNQPFVVGDVPKTLKIRSGCEGGGKGALIQEDKSATLGTSNDQTVFVPKVYGNGDSPAYNQGGMAVVTPTYSSSKASFFTSAEEELANTLVATDYKDPPLINVTDGIEYTVRRLTPTECARLQGFPDWWCEELGTENPTEGEIAFWSDVWETHRKIMGTSKKPKSQKQIIKWLQNPHSDSAEYKMWGNGVALPCVCFILSGIESAYAKVQESQ